MKALHELSWSEQLATGLDSVDHDHKHLVGIINRLGMLHFREAPAHEIRPLLTELREYSTYHFHNESKMMEDFPVSSAIKEAQHKAHASFIEHIKKSENLFALHASAVTDYLLTYLVKWLVHHITGLDTRMAREILAIRAGADISSVHSTDHTLHDDLVDTVSDLYDSLGARTLEMMEVNKKLQAYHDQQQSENMLAQDIIRRQMQRGELSNPQLYHWFLPAEVFSGDIIASLRGPQGQIYALMADATGHGLAAAITVLPVLSVFNAMAERGRPASEILGEINRHLRLTIPPGRFVAATLLCINKTDHTAEVWIGGMPDLMLFGRDGRLMQKLASTQLPLGIVDFDMDSAITTPIIWEDGSQFMICSDGLYEAANQAGEPFGEERIVGAMQSSPPAQRLSALQAALSRHMGAALPHDDISVLLIDCESAGKPG